MGFVVVTDVVVKEVVMGVWRLVVGCAVVYDEEEEEEEEEEDDDDNDNDGLVVSRRVKGQGT